MCGITGIIGKNKGITDTVIRAMTETIVHRGPDQDGFFSDEYVGLGMRRLSIIDLSTGTQPIWSQDKSRCIFFNGEIYNYKELKNELENKGRIFHTASDTEVILQMYEEYGDTALSRLRGMFAFSIYDVEKHTLFIARDHFGIKPLYYYVQDSKFIAFGSEIKSFFSIPDYVPVVNDTAVYNYLSYQYNPLTETFFKDAYKLPPGHCMSIDCTTGTFTIKKYWSFTFRPDENLDEERTTKDIQDTIRDSVAHHMIADVPVGSFLSGGVDSSIIATMMQTIRGTKKIKTFTVGFNTLTEGVEARETADFLGTDHTEITIGPDEYFSVLPKAVWHFDEPVADPSAIGLYFVSREARKHVTVVLSGEGSDELFGGYNIYLEPFARKKIAWIPHSILKLFLNIPFEFFGKNYIRRAVSRLSDWYIGNASIFKQDEISRLWKAPEQTAFTLNGLYADVANLSQSVQMEYIDIHTWLVGDILAKADKMTMAHSLELRVPFLDIEVARLASTLPDRFKWRGYTTKYLLRKAFEKIIPESTRNRKKLGFPTPVRDWFTSERAEIYEIIYTNKYIQTHMEMGHIRNLVEKHMNKSEDNSRKIYLLLMLALWYNTFIDKEKI